MNKIIRTSLSSTAVFILAACNLFGPANQGVFPEAGLQLTVQTQNNVTTYSQAGEVITYQYVVTNTGTRELSGPVTINDPARQAICPNVNTVGDLDPFLDQNETITCTATYTVTDADITAGTIVNSATATVGGVISTAASLTLTRAAPPTAQPSSQLTLSKSASSPTYGQIGQTITYTYTLTNTGTTPLGPAQFVITDNKLGAAFNCGDPNTTLAAAQSMTCTANYLITQADLSSANLTNSAFATGAGQTTAAATVTITNLTFGQPPANATATQAPPSNLAPGSTIQHQVEVGEWLIQIARCYGATLSEVTAANPHIPNKNFILPAMTITVPRIGSAGPIHWTGRGSCVVFHTVQSGNTWTSIAQQYNACLAVLQRVNPGGLIVGGSVKVPRNSAGLYCPGTTAPVATAQPGTTVPPTATTAAAQRITIDPGQTTATRIGIINPNETIRFVIAANQGQVLNVRLTAPTNEVAIGVNSPTGIALKPLDTNPQWVTTVTTSGDHVISLVAVLGTSSKSYTLEVGLSTPPAATATP